MDFPTVLSFLATAGPATIYLVGLVFLFIYSEKKDRERDLKMEALIDRYHKQVEDQIHTLTLINERLDK